MSNKPTPRMSKSAQRRAEAKARERKRNLTVGGVVAAVVVAVVVIVAAGGGGDDQPDSVADGASTDGIELEMLDGTTASLADYRGQPLVVNFFASWCVPCLAEMPGFERVSQELDGQVTFLGVNLQDRPEDGLRVVEQTGVTYDIARDPDGSLFKTFEAFAMPTTVFIDTDGNIVRLQSGEITADALADRIEDLLL